MSYGEIRFRIAKAYPAVDPDLIDGWIDDRYRAILDALEWQRERLEGVLITVAPYATGTVAVVEGSNAVTLTGGTWTAAMIGRSFRVAGRDEFYAFTRTSDTTGTLDRAYEGPDEAAAGYKIFQRVYSTPAGCRMVEAIDGLEPKSRAELGAAAPHRDAYGRPAMWAPHGDAQVELYPIPDQAASIPFSYFADRAELSAGATSAALAVWMRPAAIVAGVTADVLRHLQEWTGATLYEERYEAGLADMRRIDARSRPPEVMRMASRHTEYRVRRGMR